MKYDILSLQCINLYKMKTLNTLHVCILYRIRPLVMNHSYEKIHVFIQNDIEQLIKYLIVIIDYKDYIMDDFISFQYYFICYNFNWMK